MSLPPDIIQALVRTIEIKDASTAAHTWRVVLYARAMAERLGLDAQMIRRVTYGASLHDLGKIDVPDGILTKPGRLTEEEFEIMKTHTTLGHDRLVRMGETDPVVLNLVRHHHERWDGAGYPDGLAGNDIPLSARLFSVIDTFDALTSFRPYRQEVGEEAAERAIGAIRSGSGSRYWPDAVELFARMHDGGELNWILHHYNDEAPVSEYSSLEH
jgi:putative nucleotidyltransferase with HDIG domain